MNRLDLLRTQWDRTAAVALSAVGLVVLLVGFVRISATPYPAEQLVLVLSAGVGALFLLGVGATLWLSADLRDEWVKLDEIAVRDEELLARLDQLAAAPRDVVPLQPEGRHTALVPDATPGGASGRSSARTASGSAARRSRT